LPDAQIAHSVRFGERVALLAVANARQRLLQGLGQPHSPLLIVLQQMQRHPLGRLGPTPGRQRSALHQILETRRGHSGQNAPLQNGSFIPGGSCMPAVRRPSAPASSLDAMDRIVDAGGDQVLEHVAVLGEQRRIDLHALDRDACRSSSP
jgi:hypothetical protein